jgi:hypothetical protein
VDAPTKVRVTEPSAERSPVYLGTSNGPALEFANANVTDRSPT